MTTERSHAPTSGMGSCRRRLSSVFTSLSFACNLLRIVCRSTVYRPFLFFPQMCVKPRKSKVSALLSVSKVIDGRFAFLDHSL